MKKTIFILLFIGISTDGISQDNNINKNNVFLELFGSTVLSLNYERVFLVDSSINITGRLGGAWFPFTESFYKTYVISSSALIGKKKDRIELGLSCAYYFQTLDEGEENDLWTGLIIGYRLQPKYKHFLFRITYNPIFIKSIDDNSNPFFINSFGLSFGYSF